LLVNGGRKIGCQPRPDDWRGSWRWGGMVPRPTGAPIMTNTKKPRRMARTAQVGDAESINAAATAGACAEPRITKQGLVIDLLRQESGASLAAIVEATGWLPHTVRAALTGLRKKGHAIERSTVDSETRYTILTAAAQ
jgi:hypothetical protein